MLTENESIIKDIVGSIRKLVRAVYLDSQKMSRQYGLTGPQSIVLRLLSSNGSMSSADLSRLMYVTPSNMTGIIDRLEKKELVQRSRKEGDRRVTLISPTDNGKKLGGRIPDPIEKKFIHQLSDLEVERIQIIALAMNHLLDLIDTEEIDEKTLGIREDSFPI